MFCRLGRGVLIVRSTEHTTHLRAKGPTLCRFPSGQRCVKVPELLPDHHVSSWYKNTIRPLLDFFFPNLLGYFSSVFFESISCDMDWCGIHPKCTSLKIAFDSNLFHYIKEKKHNKHVECVLYFLPFWYPKFNKLVITCSDWNVLVSEFPRASACSEAEPGVLKAVVGTSGGVCFGYVTKTGNVYWSFPGSITSGW